MSEILKITESLAELGPQLGCFRRFINRFKRDCDTVNQFLKILKNEGLNHETYLKAKAVLENLPENSSIRDRLNRWLDEYLVIQEELNLGKIPLPVSSDIIESLFGKFKSIMERGHRSEFNRMALLIPALCGHPTNTAVIRNLETVTHNDLLQWTASHIHTTQRALHQAFRQGKLFVEGVLKTGGKYHSAA
jgi:hypothetical protein